MSFLPFLIFIAAFVVVMILQHQRAQGRLQTLEQVARKLGGRTKPGGFFRQPSLEFETCGVAAKITFTGGSKNNPACTNLEYAFPYAMPMEISITPEYFFSRLGKLFGMQDIETGDPLFDKKFIIKGNPAQAVRQFLTPAVRDSIFKLRALRMNNQVEISTRSDGGFVLRTRKLGWIDQPEHLHEFIDLSREVLRGYLEATGRPATEPRPAASRPGPRCPACGDRLNVPGQACPRCGALHHPECWQLTDGCSACGFTDRRT